MSMVVEPPQSAAPFAIGKIWAVAFVATLIFNTLVAVFLTAFAITPGDIFENLTYSYCIGFLILLGIMGPRTLIWPTGRPPPWRFALMALIGTAFGLIGGRALAAWLWGHPLHWSWILRSDSFGVSLLISVLAAFAASVYFWNREREAAVELNAARQRERAETVSRQLSETQLQLLRAQIEPHMLFNTLANLRALIVQNPRAAQGMLDHLIDFFRASLDGSRREWSSVEREFKLAADYLALLAIRLGDRLKFELDLPDALRQQPLPSMLLQPLIENAIKHGIEPSLRGGSVRVSAATASGYLVLEVLDTGVGISQQTADSSADSRADSAPDTRFGNDQLRARLQTLYGADAEFTLQPVHPTGTLARIRLPLTAATH